MRTVEEHLAAVLTTASALDALDVALLDARGCLVPEPVTAPTSLPPFDAAAVDGYAVRCADLTAALPVELRVVDDVPAGYRATEALVPGAAIRIASGAPLPEGADAIVELGLTDGGTSTVTVRAAVAPGAGIRRGGGDLRAGDVVVEAGASIGAREVALLAAVGCARVSVLPKPRVVVVTTGTELVEPGTALTPGLIPDANGYLLTAAVEDAGGLAYRAGPIADEPRALSDCLQDQLVRADLIVVTGGVTHGTYDTLKQVLAELGSVEFTRVAVTPGSAQGYGHVGPDQVPIFTLPGSPISAFVSFELFVRPVIRRLLGHVEVGRPQLTARLTEPVEGDPQARVVVPGHVEGQGEQRVVLPITEHGIAGMRLANGLIVLPEGTGALPAGAEVTVLHLGRQ